MNAEQTPIADLTTLVQGATACLSEPAGTIRGDTWQGLYHRDLRMLSHLRLTVDGQEPPLLVAQRQGASAVSQIHTVAADDNEPTALLIRRRELDGDVAEHLEIQVFADDVGPMEVVLELASDFATLRATREGIGRPEPTPLQPAGPGELRADSGRGSLRVLATGDGLAVDVDRITWHVHASPGRPWKGTVRLSAAFDGTSAQTTGDGRLQLRVESTADGWRRSVESATADLAALGVRIGEMNLSYIGAGVPWFMALFGRDTLITAHQSLIAGTDAAVDVLRALARYQGAERDARTLEQPGRILHELRTGGSQVFGLPEGAAYYGTVDATPLFVMLLAAAHRWGAADDDIAALLPAARAAVAWCEDDGDVDRDGFIEYVPDAQGLVNQGWKDSGDALVHADGRLAQGPIALAEVQAYAYGAYTGLALLEERLGAADGAAGLRQRADELRRAFRERFWLPDHRLVAMALDGDKQPLAVASSNMGHCLWAGILDADVGDVVASRLAEPDMAGRWGVRTLARSERAYNPLGYHRGTVWAHDTALAVAGLMRYGHAAAAARLSAGMLEACASFDWRMPELFAGLDSDEVPLPVPYPAACSPQAWSATAPLSLLTTMLRLEPDVPAGRVRIAPAFGDGVELVVRGVALGGRALDVLVRGARTQVLNAPDGITVETG